MPNVHQIVIAKEFSPVPAGRYRGEGKFTGQDFREKFMRPRLQAGAFLSLDLDGMESLPSSFWEEVFGGLIRDGFSLEDLQTRISLRTTEALLQPYTALAWKFAKEETSRHH